MSIKFAGPCDPFPMRPRFPVVCRTIIPYDEGAAGLPVLIFMTANSRKAVSVKMSKLDPACRRNTRRSLSVCVGRALSLALVVMAVVSCTWKTRTLGQAELVLKNAAVYTMDGVRSWADAVAVAGGRIIYVGNTAGAEKLQGPDTSVLDLRGTMILPGFHDSHIHLISGGMGLKKCVLSGITSQEEIFRKIKAYADANPGKTWIIGRGWDLPAFPEANPTKDMLDKLIPDRPAIFSAMDGHSSWVNTPALRLAGVTKDTPDPKDGRIERDKKTGEPSGTLREGAQELVEKLIPPSTDQDYEDGLQAGMNIANGFGITSILEANADDKYMETYGKFDRLDKLAVRVFASLSVDPAKGLGQIPGLVAKRARYDGRLLNADSAKIFADGVLESRTASLIDPYLDRPGYRGIPEIDPATFNPLAAALDKEGFQIHVHAIGDWAIRMTLDALEYAARINGRRDARHHIAHLELIEPEDIPRFRRLGVVANFQSLWAYDDPYIKMTEPALGPARSRWLYPIGSIVRSGGMIVGGSDWPVTSMNPLEAIQVAVTRRGLDDVNGRAWIPEEVVDLPTMLAAYTINGAFLSRREKTTGSIETGKAADLIVLDRNLFEIPPSDIHKARVLRTFLNGREVFRAAEVR